MEELLRLLTRSDLAGRSAALPGWSMPKAFLTSVLQADAGGCVMIVVPPRPRAQGLAVAQGDRLIVDTSDRQIASATYALLVEGRLELVDTRIVRGHGLAEAAARKDPGLVLLGQVVGSVTALR
jgi:hypothetical protein